MRFIRMFFNRISRYRKLPIPGWSAPKFCTDCGQRLSRVKIPNGSYAYSGLPRYIWRGACDNQDCRRTFVFIDRDPGM